MSAAVEITDLVMDYRSRRGSTRALDGASLTLDKGEVLGIVGESGSGKSTLANAIGRLPVSHIHVVSGQVAIDGTPVLALTQRDLRALRAERLAYIFQDPVGTLDPTLTVGRQVSLALGDAGRSVEDALAGLGFGDVPRLLRSYPHQISGGMAQRVAIAMAMARHPSIVIADEPTAALDASVKLQVLELLVGRCRARGASLLLLSHDLHAVRTFADRVAVFYGGRAVEIGSTATVFDQPTHPYTRALLASAVGRERAGERVEPIPGTPRPFAGRLEACAFAPRCTSATSRCTSLRPEPRAFGETTVICHHAEAALEPEAIR